jgi:hypothetical protein
MWKLQLSSSASMVFSRPGSGEVCLSTRLNLRPFALALLQWTRAEKAESMEDASLLETEFFESLTSSAGAASRWYCQSARTFVVLLRCYLAPSCTPSDRGQSVRRTTDSRRLQFHLYLHSLLHLARMSLLLLGLLLSAAALHLQDDTVFYSTSERRFC